MFAHAGGSEDDAGAETRDPLKAKKFMAIINEMPEKIQQLWHDSHSLPAGIKRQTQTAIINKAISRIAGKLIPTQDESIFDDMWHHRKSKFKRESERGEADSVHDVVFNFCSEAPC
jgi:hypothetical protein